MKSGIKDDRWTNQRKNAPPDLTTRSLCAKWQASCRPGAYYSSAYQFTRSEERRPIIRRSGVSSSIAFFWRTHVFLKDASAHLLVFSVVQFHLLRGERKKQMNERKVRRRGRNTLSSLLLV